MKVEMMQGFLRRARLHKDYIGDASRQDSEERAGDAGVGQTDEERGLASKG